MPARANPIDGLAEIKERLKTRLDSTDWDKRPHALLDCVTTDNQEALHSAQSEIQDAVASDPALEELATSTQRQPQVVVWCGTADEAVAQPYPPQLACHKCHSNF